jgi:O-antigen ligase
VLSTFQESLSVESITPVHIGRLVGQVAEWLRRQSAARELHRFGAVIGGLVLFAPLIDGGTTQVPVLIIRLVLLTSGLIWLLGRMKAGEIFLPQTNLDVCVVVFVGWAILSLLWSPYKNASLQWVLNILSYAALFVMATQGIRSRCEISTIIVVVTFLGVCEGLFGIAQYFWMGETRARGTFFNPNFFAASEATVLLLSLGMLFFTNRGVLSMFHRRWLWSSAAISLMAVVVAQSRGVSMALLGATLFLGMSRYGKKALVILSLCLLGVLVVPNPLQHRMFHAGAQDPYAYMRLDIWKSALIRLSDEPLGMGLGMFKQGSFQERFPIEGEIVRYRKRPESAHNEYLQMGVELGILGLVLFLSGVTLWAREAQHVWRVSANSMDKGLMMGLSAGVLVLLLHAGVDSTFHEPALVVLLVLIGGLVHCLYLWHRPDAVIWRRLGFSYHPLRATYVIAGALSIAAVCTQSALAWHLHEEGKRRAAQEDLEGAFTWYVLASEIDPGTTGYHDSIARTAMELYSESAKSEWLLKAAEEEAVARKLNPLDGRFPFRAGTVYRLMASQTLISAQRAEWLGDAADAFAEAIRLDPYSPFSYFELAELRLADGRVEEAIQLLTAATAHEPNFLRGRALLAELSLKIGIPGDYAQEMRNITAIHSQYAQQVRDEIERQFIDVDLYPLGRAIALRAKP